MSFYPGGGSGPGGGWPPPFFNQPPPGGVQPVPFFTDPSQNQVYPPGMHPDYQQQGYNPYIQMPTMPGQPQHQPVHQPQLQAQELPTTMPHTDRSLEREQGRSEYKSSQYSPPSHERRHSPDKSRRVPRDDGDDDRYIRKKRSPVDEQTYRPHGSDERGRQRERIRLSKPAGSPPAHSAKDKPKVDIDALLQDERLRNVLFAGISKATAKLEQSLQDGKERSDFEPQEAKNQLFPSASTSQMPRSILKRKDAVDPASSKTLSNLSALERTLHLLRGKSEVAVESTRPDNRSSSERKSPASHGALSKLSAYDEANDEDSHHYKSEKRSKERDSSASSSSKPFWSVPSKLEASKREADSFDAKEKMFEEWRQSIGKQSVASSKADQIEREKHRNVERVQYKQGVRKRDMPVGGEPEADNQEELDSTVQNILQSIGFNFDLSKRMQELAKKKRMQEDGGSGIRNVSASFMDKGDILAEELKASLLRSGSDLSSIDSLIKEVRASSQGSRRSSRVARSPSPDRRSSSFDRDAREGSQSALRYEHSAREEQFGRSKDSRASYPGNEQWEKVSPQSSPPRRHFRERVSPSPRDSYDDPSRQFGSTVSERFREDGARNEYFYPEKDYTETPPSVPLLTSLSSRKRNEDLTGGLLKSLRVENFRVLSRSTHDNPEDDTFRELRRIILPAKSDQDKGQSPPRTVMRKRSASPLAVRVSKERKMSPGYYEDYPRSGSHQGLRTPPNESPRRRSISPKRKSISPRRRSPPPKRRERSRSRTRSRSPYRRKSPSYRRRSRSPRPRSPRPRSPPRRRSRSPRRGRSRSPVRKMRTPVNRASPPRKTRRTPPRRSGRSRSRSNERYSHSSKRADFATSNRNSQKAADSKGKHDQGKKDLSRLPEKERQAELKKIVMAMENKDSTVKDDDGDKKASRVATIVSDLTTMGQMDQQQLNKLTSEALMLSADEQLKLATNMASRKSKVLALKTELERLKKAQNELMRKSQRSGLGNKDPHLRANNLSQMETEKEIDRLSVPELNVSTVSNFDQNLKEIRSKLEKETANTKQKAKNQNKSKESAVQGSSSESIAQAMRPQDNTNWTSVPVEDADLPAIADSGTKGDVKKPVKKNEKQNSVPPRPRKDVYYEYVDSKNHWCSHCHVNLNALDQYFTHLHGKKHFTAISSVAKPWEKPKDESLKSKGKIGKAQTRRIKGSELLFPVAGFYCSLCNIFSGDFAAADKHLKSDDHYDKYLDFIRDNPAYEKKLLLEKTSKAKEPSVNPNEKETKGTPAPLPTSGKKGRKTKSLRKKKVEEEKEAAGNQDNLESVDMELDDNEKDDDVNVVSKVPKMTGKFTSSVASFLSSLPESGSNNNGVEMKSNKEDEVKSLDKFLTLAQDNTNTEPGKEAKSKKTKNKKPAKIPVVGVKTALNLSDIPIPEPPKLTTIPLPPSSETNAPSTVKTLKEVEDEEKRMMGIDVDAEEEKPLGPIKRPPPLSQTDKQSEMSSDMTTELKDEAKPKTIDSLLSKVTKASSVSVIQKVKPQTLVVEEELEKKIQQGIQEKLEQEKQKLIKLQEKKERMAKKQEEKMMMKKEKKKVYSDSSSEEDSNSEDDENTEIRNESETIVSEKIKITEAESEGKNSAPEKQDDSQNVLTSASIAEVEVGTVKEEIMETANKDANPMTKLEIEDNLSQTEIETKVEDVGNSAVSMEIDHEATNDVKEENTEIVEQDSSSVEVSASATMQLMGMGDIVGFRETDVNDVYTFSSEIANKDVSQDMETMPVSDSIKVDISEELPILDAPSNQQVIDTGNESKDVSIGEEMEVVDDASQELTTTKGNDAPKLDASHLQVTEKATESRDVTDTGKESKDVSIGDEKKIMEDTSQELATLEGNDAPELDASGIQVMEVATESGYVENKHTEGDVISQQEVAEPAVVAPVTKGKKKAQMTKTAVVKALQLESDLLGVLNTSPEVLAKAKQKKNQGSGKAVARRGGKAGTRTSKKITQPSAGEEADADISMDDFVVLSEISEADDINTGKVESESCGVSVQASNDEVLVSSINEDCRTEEVEKSDEIQSIKPVSTAQQSRGGKTSTRGRGKGKRVAVKKVPGVPEESPTSLSSTEKSIETDVVEEKESQAPEGNITVVSTEANDSTKANFTPSTEEKDSAPSIEAKGDEVEEEIVPVVSRTRRGRSAAAAAKAVPAKTGRQTRTRGKKKEVEMEASVAIEDIKNTDVENTESKIDNNKSEDVSSLPTESNSTNEASVSEIEREDQSELNVRATPPGQGKNVTVMAADTTEEKIEIQDEELGKGVGLNEEKPQGRSLRSRQAKKTTIVADVDKAKDEGDSDATIPEDEDLSNQMSQSLVSVTEQVENNAKLQDLQSSVLLPTQPAMDPPMSGVVEMDTIAQAEMLPEKEVPMTTDFSGFENLPTSGLNLGLEEEDSMEFPDSLAGFTVIDVEGQPDDEDELS